MADGRELVTGRARAREAVERQMIAFGWNISDLARNSGLDVGTVGDFISGQRWAQPATQNKLEQALGWAAGSIVLITRGGEPVTAVDVETVGPGDQDADVLASLPPEALEGLDAADRAEVIAAAKLSALEKAREIRRRLDQ